MPIDPAASVAELLDLYRSSGPASDDALIALALMIEKHVCGQGASPSYFFALDELLGHSLAGRNFSEAEFDEAVIGLLGAFEANPQQQVATAWALGKSIDIRIVAPLIAVLRQSVRNPDQERLVDQIVSALALIDVDESVAAVRSVASEGSGDAKATAERIIAARSAL